jgi:hypothetical protein
MAEALTRRMDPLGGNNPEFIWPMVCLHPRTSWFRATDRFGMGQLVILSHPI